MDVFLKSIAFFKATEVKVFPQSKKVMALVFDHFPLVRIDVHAKDILYYENLDALQQIDSTLEHVHNDSMVLIADIHKNHQNTIAWNELKTHSKVTVSIDLFYCGAIFFRKEQAKEHFKIRI